ncbi:hypothetical protein [Thaumasiovibrio sp. DFM-14]|uniref:hypothetical protein n=1 Tax=Thaumasiovibrio sp. DFM-14 TaxID=3384792 RepID=UPI0039A269A4
MSETSIDFVRRELFYSVCRDTLILEDEPYSENAREYCLWLLNHDLDKCVGECNQQVHFNCEHTLSRLADDLAQQRHKEEGRIFSPELFI